jgi:hypothetical protein
MDFLWGIWNGITAWPLLAIHAFGALARDPVYDLARDGGWYQLGFLLGAGAPIFGVFGRGCGGKRCRARAERELVQLGKKTES